MNYHGIALKVRLIQWLRGLPYLSCPTGYTELASLGVNEICTQDASVEQPPIDDCLETRVFGLTYRV